MHRQRKREARRHSERSITLVARFHHHCSGLQAGDVEPLAGECPRRPVELHLRGVHSQRVALAHQPLDADRLAQRSAQALHRQAAGELLPQLGEPPAQDTFAAAGPAQYERSCERQHDQRGNEPAQRAPKLHRRTIPALKCRRHALNLLAIGDVQVDRADGTAPACAHAVAQRDVEGVEIVHRVAGVHEHRGAPFRPDPLDVLDAAHAQVASADDRAALRHTQALVGIATHRVVAAGAEHVGRGYRWHPTPRTRRRPRPAARPCRSCAPAADRCPWCRAARSWPRQQRLHGAADLQREEISRCGRDQIVEVVPAPGLREVQRFGAIARPVGELVVLLQELQGLL